MKASPKQKRTQVLAGAIYDHVLAATSEDFSHVVEFNSTCTGVLAGPAAPGLESNSVDKGRICQHTAGPINDEYNSCVAQRLNCWRTLGESYHA